MTGETLLRCPFCGGEAVKCGDNSLNPRHWVMCRSCHACSEGDVSSLEQAIAAWNTRALGPALDTVLEAVEAMSAHHPTFEIWRHNLHLTGQTAALHMLHALRAEQSADAGGERGGGS